MILKISTEDSINWAATGVEQIKNNVLNILRTRKGEVPYMPMLGLSPNYIDAPLIQYKAALMAEVQDQLRRWEPAVHLESLSIVPATTGDYIIEVVVSL